MTPLPIFYLKIEQIRDKNISECEEWGGHGDCLHYHTHAAQETIMHIHLYVYLWIQRNECNEEIDGKWQVIYIMLHTLRHI
jgi:hypothetical protein